MSRSGNVQFSRTQRPPPSPGRQTAKQRRHYSVDTSKRSGRRVGQSRKRKRLKGGSLTTSIAVGGKASKGPQRRTKGAGQPMLPTPRDMQQRVPSHAIGSGEPRLINPGRVGTEKTDLLVE